MKKKIKVVSDTNEVLFGEIKIEHIINNNAYVIWNIVNQENQHIAGLANNYFLGDKELTIDEIFELVKSQILKYRVGRKKIFTAIEYVV
jgi:hypothetical protein